MDNHVAEQVHTYATFNETPRNEASTCSLLPVSSDYLARLSQFRERILLVHLSLAGKQHLAGG